MNRRDFLKSSGRLAVGAAMAAGPWTAAGCALRPPPTDDAQLPNIVLITADDLGWKDLGCCGNGQIRTPHIDRLAHEGVRFTNAFGVASSCAPSRASLITGQYPHTNGVTGLTHIYKLKSLNPFAHTLPDALAGRGYNTALEGKWHVSPYLPAGWYGYRERLSGIFPRDMWIQDSTRTRAFIEENRNNRFYLELNYMNNHRDAWGEFSFADGFPVDPDTIRVPQYWALPDWPEIRLEVAKFYSQTMRMDRMIGDVLDTLDTLGLTRQTLVVFVSDNGPPFPGNKMTCYDRGIGTPLLFRWPEALPAGREIGELVSTIDIMPTLLEAAGLDIPARVQGASLLPTLRGAAFGPVHEAIFSEMTHHVHYLPTRAVRTRRWKYIRNYSNIAKGLDQCNHMDWAHRLCRRSDQPWKRPRVPEELYDLKTDPDEQRNLALDEHFAGDLSRMQTLLDDHMRRTNDPFRGAPFTHDFDPPLYAKKVDSEKYK